MKQYFKDWSNFFSFSLALIPSVLLYILNPDVSVPYVIFLLAVFLLLLSLWLNIKQFLDYKDRHSTSIELIRCINDCVLCRPGDLLFHHSVVSFYESQEDFEKLLFFGYVETINSNGLAQIVLLDSTDFDDDNPYQYIAAHQSNILIKPTITTEMLNNYSK